MDLLNFEAVLDLEADATLIADYAEALRRAAYRALDEEAILVAVHRVRHSEEPARRLGTRARGVGDAAGG